MSAIEFLTYSLKVRVKTDGTETKQDSTASLQQQWKLACEQGSYSQVERTPAVFRLALMSLRLCCFGSTVPQAALS